MESSPIPDQTALIADFNAITQNEDKTTALHYLEMSDFDLNVLIDL